MKDAIDNALGLTSLETSNTSLTLMSNTDTSDSDYDVDEARNNLQDAVFTSQQAVQDMVSIAQQSQHPKAYEVLNSLIKTYADISMATVDLQLKKQKLQGKTGGEPAQTVNNLFVGSTSELQKMVEDMRNKSNSNVE